MLFKHEQALWGVNLYRVPGFSLKKQKGGQICFRAHHASTDSLIELGEKSNVDIVAFYHLVPVPLNFVLEDIFKLGVPDNFLLAEDLMVFELTIDSDDILVTRP